jgi:hypothetical protein
MTSCTTVAGYDVNGHAIITTYNCTPLNPSFLPINVLRTSTATTDRYDVQLGTEDNQGIYTLTIDFTNPNNPVGSFSNQFLPVIFSQGPNGFATNPGLLGLTPNAVFNRITLTEANINSPYNINSFVPGDVYDIILLISTEAGQVLQVTPSRNQGTTFSSSLVPSPNTPVPSGASTTNNTTMSNDVRTNKLLTNHTAMSSIMKTNTTKSSICMTCPETKVCTVCNGNPNVCIGCACFTANTCGNLRVPIVNIIGQTTIDFCNVGDVIFTICDEFTYYKEQPLPPSDRCEVIYAKPEQIKQTKFHKCCPPMEIVVKGKGATLYDKAVYLYNSMASSIGPSFYTFYFNLILYGMAKYILARILYGKFDLKYLLNKYNEKFLKDLGESRFCEFILVFEDCQLSPVFGYQRFFKFGHRKSKSVSQTDQSNQSS